MAVEIKIRLGSLDLFRKKKRGKENIGIYVEKKEGKRGRNRI